MLLKPMNKERGTRNSTKKTKQERQLEKRVELALNALTSIQKADYEKAQNYLSQYKNEKESDPEMLLWLTCLKDVHTKKWLKSNATLSTLSQQPTAIGLQSKRLKLEIIPFLDQ